MDPNSPKQREIAQRRIRVAALHAEGKDYREIGEYLSVDKATVSRDMTFLRKQWRAAIADVAQEYEDAYHRYHDIIQKSYETGDYKTALNAQNAIARLMGMQKPVQREVTHTGSVGVSINIRPVTADASSD